MPTPGAKELIRDWRWFRRPLPPASVAEDAEAATHWRFPTRWARSRPASALRAFLQAGVLHPLLRSQLSVTVEGRERVAGYAGGPLILAPNHSSHLDAPLVLTSLPRELRRDTVTLAASDYFFDAWWRAAVTALVFNASPLDRTVGSREALPTDLLEQGYHLLIFPEGTRSQDGYVARFRHGAAHLAYEVGLPVVPIAIQGAWRAMPRGQGWPSSGRPRVRVAFGQPLHPKPDGNPTELTRRVEAAVAVLLDEQHTDWWTALRNAQRGSTPSPRGPAIADWRRRWELLEPEQADDSDRRVWRRDRDSA